MIASVSSEGHQGNSALNSSYSSYMGQQQFIDELSPYCDSETDHRLPSPDPVSSSSYVKGASNVVRMQDDDAVMTEIREQEIEESSRIVSSRSSEKKRANAEDASHGVFYSGFTDNKEENAEEASRIVSSLLEGVGKEGEEKDVSQDIVYSGFIENMEVNAEDRRIASSLLTETKERNADEAFQSVLYAGLMENNVQSETEPRSQGECSHFSEQKDQRNEKDEEASQGVLHLVQILDIFCLGNMEQKPIPEDEEPKALFPMFYEEASTENFCHAVDVANELAISEDALTSILTDCKLRTSSSSFVSNFFRQDMNRRNTQRGIGVGI